MSGVWLAPRRAEEISSRMCSQFDPTDLLLLTAVARGRAILQDAWCQALLHKRARVWDRKHGRLCT